MVTRWLLTENGSLGTQSQSCMRPSLLALLLLGALPLFAQAAVCNCRADLTALYGYLQATPSYQRTADKDGVAARYRALLETARTDTPVVDCHRILVQLLRTVRDNHLAIRHDPGVDAERVANDTAYVAELNRQPYFKQWPRPAIDLDSLERALRTRGVYDPEGIYESDNARVAVYRSGDNELRGLVVQSKYPLWQPGDVVWWLYPKGEGFYEATLARPGDKRLIHFRDFLIDGMWQVMPLLKMSEVPGFYSPTEQRTYALTELRPEVQYLRLGSFGSYQPNLAEADAFTESIRGKLTAPHLIVDLRDNGGGGRRVSKPLFKLLKKHAKRHRLYVLTNFSTASEAEQTAVKLSKLDRVRILGAPTNGTIAYGTYKLSAVPLPSGVFRFYRTDKAFPKYLPYEDRGVQPEVLLDTKRDWVEQVLELVE